MTVRRDDIAYYEEMFANMEVMEGWRQDARVAADRILSGQSRYQWVANACGKDGVATIPWVFLGLLHFRESGCDFRRQLLNGEPWNKKTTAVPAGYGPWESWEEGSVFGMRHWGMTRIITWPVGRIFMETEDWNGEGYEKLGLNSPYNWRGTPYCVGVGKFVERNGKGVYVPAMEFRDRQVGCGPVLKALIDMGAWVAP